MPYARCSECGQTIQVEKVTNDVMMMWHGTHCGTSRAYFAYKDVFETADDLEEKKVVAIRLCLPETQNG
jgi:ribosomal protein L37AE/L43A